MPTTLRKSAVVEKRAQLKPRDKAKSFEIDYNKTFECMTLEICDTEGMFPLVLLDPKAGKYKIARTKRGGLQMTRY